MKKGLMLLSIIAVLVIGAIFSLATVDFNHLGKENAYVHITTAGSVEEVKLESGEVIKSYWYTLPSYTESGEMIEVEFSAAKELRQQAYLMLYIKNSDEVTSYDEVQLKDIPEKAREKMEK